MFADFNHTSGAFPDDPRLRTVMVSIDQLATIIGILLAYVPLFTLAVTLFLAWYVNYAVKARFYKVELMEKRLRELYRPMDMILKASKSAFQRYFQTTDEEKSFIADLWRDYNSRMKELLMKNSYLMLEPEVPSQVIKLLEHIDAYLFDYQQYKSGKTPDPFPGKRGYAFPDEVNDYFASNSQKLAELLGGKHFSRRRVLHLFRRTNPRDDS